MVHPLQPPAVRQASEPFADRAAGRSPVRQRTPGTAGAQEVKDGIQDRAERVLPAAPRPRLLRQEWLQERPLRVSEPQSFLAPCPCITLPGFNRPHSEPLLIEGFTTSTWPLMPTAPRRITRA